MDEAHSPCESWGSRLALLVAYVIFDDGEGSAACGDNAVGARPKERLRIKRPKLGSKLFPDETRGVCFDSIDQLRGLNRRMGSQKEMAMVGLAVGFEHLAARVEANALRELVDAASHGSGNALVSVLRNKNQMEVKAED